MGEAECQGSIELLYSICGLLDVQSLLKPRPWRLTLLLTTIGPSLISSSGLQTESLLSIAGSQTVSTGSALTDLSHSTLELLTLSVVTFSSSVFA